MITTLYAGLLAILYLGLTAYVIRGRYKHRVGLGDGGNPDLARRVRMHGNFAEFVPFALLLLLLLDIARMEPVIVHVLGIMLLTGRVAHVWGLHKSDAASPGRMIGMILTILMIAISAILLLWNFIALRLTGF